MNNDDVKKQMQLANEKMQAAVDHLESALLKIRAGKASPSMLNGVMVDYYGNKTPINQVANLSASDAHTILIQPWDKNMIKEIEAAIMNSNLGLNPDNNGEAIRVNIPALTEERRKELVKQAKQESESAKISIRNARHDAISSLKKMVKDGLSEDLERDGEEEVQNLTNKYGKEVDTLLSEKEADIMTI